MLTLAQFAMARRQFSTLTTQEVKDFLREAELAQAGGGMYISGGAADVSWARFRDIPVQQLVLKLQRELAILGDVAYPAKDYIPPDVTRVIFS